MGHPTMWCHMPRRIKTPTVPRPRSKSPIQPRMKGAQVSPTLKVVVQLQFLHAHGHGIPEHPPHHALTMLTSSPQGVAEETRRAQRGCTPSATVFTLLHSLQCIHKLWHTRTTLTPSDIGAANHHSAKVGQCWTLLQWQPSPWVHWLTTHSAHILTLHRTFTGSPPFRRSSATRGSSVTSPTASGVWPRQPPVLAPHPCCTCSACTVST